MPKYDLFSRDLSEDENLDDFDSEDWDELIGPTLADKLEQAAEREEGAGGYVRAWPTISEAYRSRLGYRCENCGAVLMGHKHLLHVHHRDHNKWNNRSNNLIALCALCHNDYHGFSVQQLSDSQREIIIACRPLLR